MARRARRVAHELHLGGEVERRRAGDRAPARLGLGARERQLRAGAGEQDRVTRLPAARDAADVGHEADAADDRRRVDRPAVGVVVERDVPRDDRDAERLAGERHPLDRLGELPADLRLLGVAEVEAVGEAERLAADARDVAGGLEHGELAAEARVERAEPALAVERERQAAPVGTKPEDGGVETGPAHRARLDELVVAPGHEGPRAQLRRAEQLGQRLGRGGDRRRRLGGRDPRPLLDRVARALVREEPRGDRADLLVVPERAQEPGVGDLADHRAVELPAVDHRLDLGEPLGVDDRDHPLLRLRDHHLPRLHALLALRHAVEVDVDPVVGGHLGEGRGKACGAAVLKREHEAALDELDGHLDQPLARERVAHLDGRALLRVVLAELGAREHGGAADPVAPRRRAVEDDERTGPRRLRAGEPLRRKQPDAHGVDEAVRGVALVEDDLAADVRHADAVAVVADPADGAREVVVGRAEPEPVEEGDGSGAHRRDVAQDPADARRGALERLDGRGVVVALHLERDCQPVAEVEHARILARPLEDALAVARQPAKQERRVLVPAVLRPEEREDRELEVVRLAVEQREDSVELPVREAELAMERLLSEGAQVMHPSPGASRHRRFPRAR